MKEYWWNKRGTLFPNIRQIITKNTKQCDSNGKFHTFVQGIALNTQNAIPRTNRWPFFPNLTDCSAMTVFCQVRRNFDQKCNPSRIMFQLRLLSNCKWPAQIKKCVAFVPLLNLRPTRKCLFSWVTNHAYNHFVILRFLCELSNMFEGF